MERAQPVAELKAVFINAKSLAQGLAIADRLIKAQYIRELSVFCGNLV